MHLYLVLLLAQTAGINVTNSVWSELHRCVLLLDSFDHDTDTNIGGSLIPVIPEWTSKQSNNLHKWLTSTGTSTRSHLPKLSGKVSCGFSAQHMTNWTSGILVLPVQHGKKEKKKNNTHSLFSASLGRQLVRRKNHTDKGELYSRCIQEKSQHNNVCTLTSICIYSISTVASIHCNYIELRLIFEDGIYSRAASIASH